MLALVKLHITENDLVAATLVVNQQMQELLQGKSPPEILENILLAMLAAAATKHKDDDVTLIRQMCTRFSRCCEGSDAAEFLAAQLQLLSMCNRLKKANSSQVSPILSATMKALKSH